MVRKYDHVKPRRDLERWLKCVDMTEEEFDSCLRYLCGPPVWRIEDGQSVRTTFGEKRVRIAQCVIKSPSFQSD